MEIIQSETKVESIKIKIIKEVKKSKKGIKFTQYHTYMDLIPEGKTERESKWVQVKFTREVKQSDLEQIGSGFIYCKSDKVNAPKDFYRIKTDDEGNKVYPTVWVHEVEKFEPYRSSASQDSFSLEPPVKSHQVETETKETNETVIDETDYEKYYK